MAKQQLKEKTKPRVENKKASSGPEAGILVAEAVKGSGAGNVGQIRDILFGAQMKDYERRFARFEERLNKEAEELRADVKKRLDNLEAFISSENESLSERLKVEQDGRTKAMRDVAEELRNTAHALEASLSRLEERMTKGARDFRQQLLDQSKQLSDELTRKYDQSMSTIESVSKGLRDDKVDRSVLSNLFAEVALRLTNDNDLAALMESVDSDNV